MRTARKRGTKRVIVGVVPLVLRGVVLGAAFLLGIQPMIAAASPLPARPLTLHDWGRAVEALQHPSGCFSASYPAVQLRPTRCDAPSDVPSDPSTKALAAMEAGPRKTGGAGSNDYSASVTGLISADYASFANVSSGITEKGPYEGAGPNLANAYTLQLNSSFFETPACDDAGVPSDCLGWQQFIFNSHNNQLAMEYWLLNYDATCPSTWVGSGSDCYVTNAGVTLPGGTVPVSDLAEVNMTAFAEKGGDDSLVLQVGQDIVITSNTDDVLDLAYAWNEAQWGIFGDNGDGEAFFNHGASLEAEQQITSSNGATPTCVNADFTGESNNLNRTTTPALTKTPQFGPEMASVETEGAKPAASCATIGDSQPPATFLHVAYVADNSSQNLLESATAHPLAWPKQSIRIQGQSSPSPPAVVQFGNEFVAAYTSTNSTHDIYVSVSPNGFVWSPGTVVAGQTTDLTPALADYGGVLVMAYIAANSSHDVVVTTTQTPLNWADNEYAIPQQSPDPPALAVYGSQLVMAFRLNNGSNDLGITTTTDASDWGDAASVVSGQTSALGPAISVYNNQLVMAYIANNGTNDVYVTTTSDPLAWSNNGYSIPQQSPDTPSLYPWEGTLYMALRLNNNSDGIGVTATETPAAWGTTDTSVPKQLTGSTPVLY